MRAYQPIWHKLKSLPLHEAATKGVSVTANRVLHPRILKAVVKEKWLDIEYKLTIEPHTMILYHSRKHSVITFYLRQQISAINEGCV
jgi:hypothetical protein